MNYRHAFHAGSFADVFKHAVLGRILHYLRGKEPAFRVIDTHAGAGLYDLTGSEPALLIDGAPHPVVLHAAVQHVQEQAVASFVVAFRDAGEPLARHVGEYLAARVSRLEVLGYVRQLA